MIVITKRHTEKEEIIEVYEGEYDYFGRVLSPALLKTYKEKHSTVISNKVYEAIGEERLIQELCSLTGEDVGIEVINHYEFDKNAPTIKIYRKNHYWYYEEGEYFYLYNYNDFIEKVDKDFLKEYDNKNKPFTTKARKYFNEKYQIGHKWLRDEKW